MTVENSELYSLDNSNNALYKDICRLVEEARNYVATTANTTMTLLYWRIGVRINNDLLDGQRAAYGKQIVSLLATKLQTQYGKRGFQERNIRRMMQFAQVFPDEQIVVSLIRQLSWTHFIALIPLKDDIQREFYALMCQSERWNVKTP